MFCEIQKTTNEKGLTCRYREPRMILRAVPRLWALRINCIKTRPPIDLKMSLMQWYMPRLNCGEIPVGGAHRLERWVEGGHC